MPDVIDIVMASHNNLKNTVTAVEALFENTLQPFRLIVIDDSMDMTARYLKELADAEENVRIIVPEAPITQGNQLHQLALQHTNSEYFVFMANSIVVEPEWLDVPLKIMAECDDVGVIGAKLLYPDGRIEHAGMTVGKKGTVVGTFDYGRGQPGHRFNGIVKVQAVGFALVLLRRQAMESFTPDFTTYHGFSGMEDVDDCFTIREKGWKIIYCGSMVAYHNAKSTRGNGLQKADEFYNLKAFFTKWKLGELINAK